MWLTHGKVIMLKSLWIFVFCVFSNKIITASASSLTQLPLLSEVKTSCTTGANCEEKEPVLQDDRGFMQPEPKIATEDISPSVDEETKQMNNKELILSDTEPGEENNIELEATEFGISDLDATKSEEILETPNLDDNIVTKEELRPNTEVLPQKCSKNDEILAKIESAISKSKVNSNMQTFWPAPDMVPIFKPKPNNVQMVNSQSTIPINKKPTCESESSPITPKPCNQETSKQNFSITGVYLKPLNVPVSNALYKSIGNDISVQSPTSVTPNIQLTDKTPLTKTSDLKSIKEASDVRIMPNILNYLSQRSQNYQTNKLTSAITPKSDNKVMVLYRPEIITLEQFYGEFMKKLTMTVLVPFYVSKLTNI